MTQIEIINKVLVRLRESKVSTVAANDYSQLMGEFLNEVIGELNDRWDWSQSIYRTDFTLTAGARTVNTMLVGSIDNANVTNETSKPWGRWDDRNNPYNMAFETTAGKEFLIPETHLGNIRIKESMDNILTGRPEMWSWHYETVSGERGVVIDFDRETDIERTYSFYFYTPQRTLEVDGSDDNTEVLLPSRPLINGVLFYALNERGEEIGEPGNVAESRYVDSVGAAIEDDERIQKRKQVYFHNNEVWSH